MTYDQQQWQQDRENAYAELNLPIGPQLVLERLQQEYDTVAHPTERGWPHNPFARIQDGKLRLRRPDSIEIPPEVEPLRRRLSSHLPPVRIDKLLEEVDILCGFSRAFQPLDGDAARHQPLYGTLMAAILAQGTNLGLMAMGHSAEGISTDMLQTCDALVCP